MLVLPCSSFNSHLCQNGVWVGEEHCLTIVHFDFIVLSWVWAHEKIYQNIWCHSHLHLVVNPPQHCELMAIRWAVAEQPQDFGRADLTLALRYCQCSCNMLGLAWSRTHVVLVNSTPGVNLLHKHVSSMVGKMGACAYHRRFYVWEVLCGCNRHGKITQMKGEKNYMAKSVIRGSISLLDIAPRLFLIDYIILDWANTLRNSFFSLKWSHSMHADIGDGVPCPTPARHHLPRGITHHCYQ